MNERDFFILGGRLMHDEIEARLAEDPNALAPRRIRDYPWGAALRERADEQLGYATREEEYVVLRDGAWREFYEAQRDHDRKTGYCRSNDEQAPLPLRDLPWSKDMGCLFAQFEIDEYIRQGGPANREWCWEYRDGEETYLRLKRFLDTRFNCGACCVEAAQARNKYLIKWSESDHPDAVALREYAAKLPLFAPVPQDENGNIGVTPCVIAGEMLHEDGAYPSVRVVLPLGLKWRTLNRHRLMELKPEAGPPRFFGDNWIVYTPERENIYDIYRHGVKVPPYFELVEGMRVTSRDGKVHGTVARRCRRNVAFIKWDNKPKVDYGEFGDWYWWWHLLPEATSAQGVASEQENARLRDENARLRDENNRLKQAIFYARRGLDEIEVENTHGRSRLRLRRKRADHRASACARPAARRG